jgi:putative inorganic carbon (hco3(-)) transporter
MFWLYGILIALAPLYVWRFSIGGLPTNFLMLFGFVVVGVGAIEIMRRGQFGVYLQTLKEIPRVLRWAVIAFYWATIISLFVGGFDLTKFAQWIVLYALPLKLAAQLYFFVKQAPDRRIVILNFIYAFLFGVGVVAIAQYFWLLGLPMDWWGNSAEPKRAIGFFIHPNGLALFITPLLAYLLPDLKMRLESLSKELWSANLARVLAWLFGVIALMLSLSRGGWLGLAAASGAFVVLASSKKFLRYYFLLAVVAVGIIIAVPNLRYRIILPFYGEKSSVARLSLWETGTKMIADSPILGQGINGFNYNWDKFNTDPNLDHYNFPHNFILNTWVDLGLLGLVSWLVIVGWGIWHGFKNRSAPYAVGLALFLIALLAHGLIDIPFFKNDLAMIFWLIFAIAL